MIAQDTAMIVTERTKMGIEEINIPREIEADGYITRKQDLRSRPLERVTDTTANPTSECCYPRCEECKDYVSYKGANYCTVPMVITKQTWLLTTALITDLRRDIGEVSEMVCDHILNEKSRDESGNYSVEDGFQFLTDEEYEALSPLNKYWYDKAVATYFSVGWEEYVESATTDKEPKSVRIVKSAPLPKKRNEP